MHDPTPAAGLAIALVAAGLTSAAAAQSTSLAADTAVGVYAAEYFFGGSSYQGMPAGTPVTAIRTFRAATATGHATVIVHPLPLGVRVQESGSARRNAGNPFGGVAVGTAQDAAVGAPHALLWTLRGPGAGRVVVDLDSSVSEPFTLLLRFAVDVGADGSEELSQHVYAPGLRLRRTLPVSFPRDLPVRVTVEASASASSLNHNPDYALDLTLQYVPEVPAATFTPYGTGCGPVLTGADRPVGLTHRLEFAISGGLPSAYSAFVFGTQRIASPLLGTACLLLTDPVANVFGVTTPTGAARFTLDLPGPVPVADVQVQGISFDLTPRVSSTAGLEVTIRD